MGRDFLCCSGPAPAGQVSSVGQSGAGAAPVGAPAGDPARNPGAGAASPLRSSAAREERGGPAGAGDGGRDGWMDGGATPGTAPARDSPCRPPRRGVLSSRDLFSWSHPALTCLKC